MIMWFGVFFPHIFAKSFLKLFGLLMVLFFCMWLDIWLRWTFGRKLTVPCIDRLYPGIEIYSPYLKHLTFKIFCKYMVSTYHVYLIQSFTSFQEESNPPRKFHCLICGGSCLRIAEKKRRAFVLLQLSLKPSQVLGNVIKLRKLEKKHHHTMGTARIQRLQNIFSGREGRTSSGFVLEPCPVIDSDSNSSDHFINMTLSDWLAPSQPHRS